MKKIIIAILVVLLVINPVGVYASSTAATLEVAGSLASGGLDGGAQSEKLAIAFTLMIMSGLGMQVQLTEQAKAAGETAENYIRNLYAQWVGGTSANQLTNEQREELKKRFKIISTGGTDNNGNSNNKVGRNGKIFLAAASLGLIQKFLTWLKKRGQIHRDADISVEGSANGTYYANELMVNTSGQYGQYIAFVAPTNVSGGMQDRYDARINVAFVFSGSSTASNNTLYAYIVDDGNTYGSTLATLDLQHWSSGAFSKRNGYIFFHFGNVISPIDVNKDRFVYFGDLGFQNIESYLDALNGFEIESGQGSPAENFINGDYNSSDLDNPNNQYTQIDPELYRQLIQGLDANTLATINITDYINAILQQLNRQSNPSAVPGSETVPVQDSEDLNPIPQPLPDPVPDPVPITPPGEEPAPGENDPPADSDPVSNPDPAPPDVSVPKMMIPLDEYFPFCIPFDVYHLLQKLSADPVAPSYTIGFTVYGTEVNYTISLAAFSGAMVIVRRMELLVCVIGLAIASRKIFTR